MGGAAILWLTSGLVLFTCGAQPHLPWLRVPDHRRGDSSTPSPKEWAKSFVPVSPPVGAVNALVNLSQRVASLVVASLVFVAMFVAELATLAPVPATADTILNPVTAYVTNQGVAR